jgi:hypothetical protein
MTSSPFTVTSRLEFPWVEADLSEAKEWLPYVQALQWALFSDDAYLQYRIFLAPDSRGTRVWTQIDMLSVGLLIDFELKIDLGCLVVSPDT